MKKIRITHLSMLMISALSLISCATDRANQGGIINSSSSSGSSNPLNPAGTLKKEKPKPKPKASASFAPGTYLATQSTDASFFSRFPTRSDQPIKTLSKNTEVKVISSQASYTKVEVVKTGQVGFVPTVILGKKSYTNPVAARKKATQPAVKLPSYSSPTVPEISPIANTIPPLPTPAAPAIVAPSLPKPAPFSVVEDLPVVAPDPLDKGLGIPEIINPLLPAE